jgi:hypothetical protein
MSDKDKNETYVLQLHHLARLVALFVHLGQVFFQVLDLKVLLAIKLIDSNLCVQDTLDSEKAKDKLEQLLVFSLRPSLTLLLILRGVHHF